MRWIFVFLHDLSGAFRKLSRVPRFSIPAICAIALGIGCATAVFSVADRILFRDPPYPNGSRLVSLGVLAPIVDGEFQFAKYALIWKREQKPFESLTAWGSAYDCDLSDNHPQRISCAEVDSDFLSTFGVHPLFGRNFTPEEDRPNAPKVALISQALWASRFARDPHVLDRTFSLDGQIRRIVGVLPPNFEMPTMANPGVLVPLALDPALAQGPNPGRNVRLFARLRQDVSISQAKSAMQPLFNDFVQAAPPPFRKVLRLQVRSLKDFQFQDSRLAATLLFAAALALLLIVCANLGNLMLGRSVERRREFAVRSALGASLGRVFSERLAEAFAASFTGCVLGCLLAFTLLRVAASLAPESVLHLHNAPMDARVLIFAVAAALFTTLLSVLTTMFERPGPEWLTGGTMQTPRRSLLRSGLLALQVAVALVLLTNAILLVRSLYLLQQAPLGLSTEHRLTAELTIGTNRYSELPQRVAFYEELERRIAEVPGVTSYALSDTLPPSSPARTMPFVALHTDTGATWNEERGTGPEVGWRAVTPRYFSTLGIPIVRGRPFQDEDRAAQSNTIVLNQALTDLLFPNTDPVGHHLRFSESAPGVTNPWLTVVGIVGNAANGGLGVPSAPEFYLPRRHSADDMYLRGASSRHLSITLLSPVATDSLAQQIREKVASLDPTLPVETATMQDRVAQLAVRPRFNATLLALFAAAGILLTAIGVYGVLALLVAQRTREIGIRMAVGATPARILRMVLSQGMAWVAAGTVAGVLCTLMGGRYERAVLFGVLPNNPAILAGSASLILLIAALAIVIPSIRAARVDPMISLRQE